QVEATALSLADRRREELKAVVQPAQVGDLLPPELLPHEVRGREDARVLLPSQPLAVWQQGGGDVAHHYPPGVAIALGGEDGVVDRGREPAEDAGGEQERLAGVLLRGGVDP